MIYFIFVEWHHLCFRSPFTFQNFDKFYQFIVRQKKILPCSWKVFGSNISFSSIKWFCNHYLISQAICEDTAHLMPCSMYWTNKKIRYNTCFFQVLIGWRKGMVDKWKRFASEMGRYWMEFIPIQLALCHQVCPTENRCFSQQE